MKPPYKGEVTAAELVSVGLVSWLNIDIFDGPNTEIKLCMSSSANRFGHMGL
jgi:hypothetical protein